MVQKVLEHFIMIGIKFFLLFLILIIFPASSSAEEVIVFLGDSISQLGIYPNELQLWYALKYPRDKRIIYNAGMAGDQAKNAVLRLQQDVLCFKPDHVYILFGINDIQRHLYRNDTWEIYAAQRQKAIREYYDSMSKLVELLRRHNIAVTLLSPSPYDQYSALPHPSEGNINDEGLSKVTTELFRLSKEKNIPLIDIFSPMTVLLKKYPGLQLCGSDRIHPLSNGQRLMAALIFEKNDIPHPAIETNYRNRTISAKHCSVVRTSFSENCLSWEIQPEQLPFPDEKIRQRLLNVYDFSKLDSMRFAITGLPLGTWSLKSGDNVIISADAGRWGAGVDLSSLKLFPPQMQAQKALAVQRELLKLQTEYRLCRLAEVKIRSVGGNPTNSSSREWGMTEFLKKSGNHQYYKYVFDIFRKKQTTANDFFKQYKILVDKLYSITQPEIFHLTLQKEK